MKKNKSVDPARIGLTSYDATAHVQKNSDAGLCWKPLGAATAAVRVGKHTPVMIFNDSGGTKFVAFGTSSLLAPTGAANGLPVMHHEPVVFNSGDSEYIIASGASVYVYTADPEIDQ